MTQGARSSKRPAAPKRGRGRPRKDGHGRVQTQTWLPAELARQLDAYVADLQKVSPGASRGDVIAEALRTHRPFRLWLIKDSTRALINRSGKSRLRGQGAPAMKKNGTRAHGKAGEAGA